MTNRYDNLRVDELLAIDTALASIDETEARAFFLHRLGDLYAFDGLTAEAEIFQMVADTEDAIATGTKLTDGIVLIKWHRDGTTADELRLWCDLAGTEDRNARADILTRLRPYVAKRVGEAAATELYKVRRWECEVARQTRLMCGGPARRFSRWFARRVRRWFR